MTSSLKITYELVGTGWSKCVLELGETKVELSASYLSNALGNLVLFALAIASGFHSASISFDEEPGEYRWSAERTDASVVSLQILEFDELWGNRPTSEGRVLLQTQMHPLRLKQSQQPQMKYLEDLVQRTTPRNGLNTRFPNRSWRY